MPPLLCVIPSIYSAYRLAYIFIRYTGVIKVSDILLDIVMLGFTMLFWHMCAKTVSGTGSPKTVQWLYGFGFPAALISFVCAVPKYYIAFFLPDTALIWLAVALTLVALARYTQNALSLARKKGII